MALYRITNLKQGTIVLPPPLSRRLNKGETVSISAPAGMTEANFNRQYSALVSMQRGGMIAIKTVEDHSVDDNIEVATVSMLGSVTAAGQYRAVANVAARDAIPVGERTEGMLVRTNDSGDLWTLGSDLLTWTLLVVSGAPGQYLAVANNAARDAIPALDRVEGMVVRTNDSGLFWVLASDLTTWTQVDAVTQQTLSNILTVLGTIPTSTSLAGLLTGTSNFFPFSDLPDPTPSVVEALNILNAQIGNRTFVGPILTNGQTVSASLQALSAAIGSGGLAPTQIGQTIWSVDGLTFSPQLPLTSVAMDRGGWLLNDQGYMLVVG